MQRLQPMVRPPGGRAPGLLSPPTPRGLVHARRFAPPEDLADIVESLWVAHWDLRGRPPHVIEMISDPSLHLCLEVGFSRVVGVWTGRWTRQLRGQGRVRALKLRPGAAAALGVPAWRWTDRLSGLGTATQVDLPALERAGLQPEDDEEGLAALSDALRRLRRARWPDPQLAMATVDAITGQNLASVQQLARATGLGVRSLQRLFREHVGASPKLLMRRHRLQCAAVMLESGRVPRLAEFAAELGYTDQAHFTRDFVALVGRSPLRFSQHLRTRQPSQSRSGS